MAAQQRSLGRHRGLRSALVAAEEPDATTEEVIATLRTATQLYEGDLLAGCYDEWLVDARERLRDRYTSALRRLVALLADQGDHSDAVLFGRELVRDEPLQEDSYRLLMRAHAAAGDRAAAVRVYHECAATLERELGVEPSRETRHAYAALTRSEPRDDPVISPVRVSGAALIDRDHELDWLTRC